jgi:hypothetical protein
MTAVQVAAYELSVAVGGGFAGRGVLSATPPISPSLISPKARRRKRSQRTRPSTRSIRRSPGLLEVDVATGGTITAYPAAALKCKMLRLMGTLGADAQVVVPDNRTRYFVAAIGGSSSATPTSRSVDSRSPSQSRRRGGDVSGCTPGRPRPPRARLRYRTAAPGTSLQPALPAPRSWSRAWTWSLLRLDSDATFDASVWAASECQSDTGEFKLQFLDGSGPDVGAAFTTSEFGPKLAPGWSDPSAAAPRLVRAKPGCRCSPQPFRLERQPRL